MSKCLSLNRSHGTSSEELWVFQGNHWAHAVLTWLPPSADAVGLAISRCTDAVGVVRLFSLGGATAQTPSVSCPPLVAGGLNCTAENAVGAYV